MTAEACAWLIAQRRATRASTDYAQNECNKEVGRRPHYQTSEVEHGSP